MVTGVQDNQQPDDLEAGEGVYVTIIIIIITTTYIHFQPGVLLTMMLQAWKHLYLGSFSHSSL